MKIYKNCYKIHINDRLISSFLDEYFLRYWLCKIFPWPTWAPLLDKYFGWSQSHLQFPNHQGASWFPTPKCMVGKEKECTKCSGSKPEKSNLFSYHVICHVYTVTSLKGQATGDDQYGRCGGHGRSQGVHIPQWGFASGHPMAPKWGCGRGRKRRKCAHKWDCYLSWTK